jgi:CheY-like chemotaxis protein
MKHSTKRVREPLRKAKIMIVEDEVISALALKEELQNLGFFVCSLASSGEKAIEIAAREHPDIALMDLGLLDEMDGIAASREIWSRYSIPSIYITGSPEKLMKHNRLTESIECLIKPVEIDDLKAAVDSALGKANLGQENDV